MPIYEYRCQSCGETFETYRGLKDSDSEVKCPDCGSKTKRIISKFFGKGSTTDSCGPTFTGG